MRYYCTYFDSNYLVRALPMILSLKKCCRHPYVIYVLCLDDVCFSTVKSLNYSGVIPIPLAELEAVDNVLFSVKSGRSKIEYYFSCTAAFMRFLFSRFTEIDLLTYLDSDLYFFSSLDPVFEELGSSSILIIPHRFSDRLKFLQKNGQFNVGLVSVRRDDDGMACVNWWHERCMEWCFDRNEDGRFADQGYLDQFPKLFGKVCVLQNKGANLAPWNIEQYCIREKDGTVHVDESFLIFYHFQGYRQLSHHFIDPGIMPLKDKDQEYVMKYIYFPYIREIFSAKNLLKIAFSDKSTFGNTRHYVESMFDSFSRKYQIRCFLQGKVVGRFAGRPWYVSPSRFERFFHVYDFLFNDYKRNETAD